MMEPLPNCFSICARAACRALALASSMTFPSLTILIISYIFALKRAPATVIFSAPDALQRPNAQSKKPVDLGFYTVLRELQPTKANRAVRHVSALVRDALGRSNS